MCIGTSSTGITNDFDKINVSSNKCEKNHYDICQSMAKFKSTGQQKYYGIGENDKDGCYCYISKEGTLLNIKHIKIQFKQ